MCYLIVKENGQVITWTTVHSLFGDEIHSETEKQKCDQFNKAVADFIGDFDSELILEVPNDEPKEPEPADTTITPTKEPKEEANDNVMGPDPIINATIYIYQKETDKKQNANGLLISRKNCNPMLDSCIYIIEFPNGKTQEISYNTIAEHLSSQVDLEGNQHQIFYEIINHRKKKEAVDTSDQYQHHGNKHIKKKTITGWDLEVEWHDGTT